MHPQTNGWEAGTDRRIHKHVHRTIFLKLKRTKDHA